MAGTTAYTQWQTARANVLAVDTPLTNYKPADLTAAVRAKMFSIHPATAILLRGFGVGSSNNSAVIVVSGWMKPDRLRAGASAGVSNPSSGPGHRLWRGQTILGAKSLAGDLPSEDKKWPAGTYLEVDTFDPSAGYDPAGATRIEVADQEAVLVLPTLGYTNILIEVVTMTTLTNIGFLWRPAIVGGVIKTF